MRPQARPHPETTAVRRLVRCGTRPPAALPPARTGRERARVRPAATQFPVNEPRGNATRERSPGAPALTTLPVCVICACPRRTLPTGSLEGTGPLLHLAAKQRHVSTRQPLKDGQPVRGQDEPNPDQLAQAGP